MLLQIWALGVSVVEFYLLQLPSCVFVVVLGVQLAQGRVLYQSRVVYIFGIPSSSSHALVAFPNQSQLSPLFFPHFPPFLAVLGSRAAALGPKATVLSHMWSAIHVLRIAELISEGSGTRAKFFFFYKTQHHLISKPSPPLTPCPPPFPHSPLLPSLFSSPSLLLLSSPYFPPLSYPFSSLSFRYTFLPFPLFVLHDLHCCKQILI